MRRLECTNKGINSTKVIYGYMKLSDVMHETPDYWVLRVKNGFEVYKTGITHSVRCAQIGWRGQKGLDRAITECSKRQALI